MNTKYQFRLALGVLGILIGAVLVFPNRTQAAVWQYSVPMPQTQEQRAYLWIPPYCRRVRGLLVGLQNMLEKPMFQDPTIRNACAEADLGIVWVSPGDEEPVHPSLSLLFPNPQVGVDTLQQALTALAHESGYSEIQYAPLLPVGHSAATPFVWGMGFADASRVFAVIPYKGWVPGHAPDDIPILHVTSEWAEWGANWGSVWKSDQAAVLKMRAASNDCLLGEFDDIGAGHFDWNAASAKVIAQFIVQAAKLCIPAQEPIDGPVTLTRLAPQAGWLIDADQLGTPAGIPVPYSQYKGNRGQAFWYFSRQMAETANNYMSAQLEKKPEMIDFVVNGQPAPLVKNGFAEMTPTLLPDGVSFQVHATYLDKSPSASLFPGVPLGHAPGPILFRVSTGALKQTGPDTFRVWMGRGGVTRQGPPWEPWIMAYQSGNGEYRATDRPMHVWIAVNNTAGEPQTITFPAIPDQPIGVKSLKLHATASSGLPVQLYVVSGPAQFLTDNRTLQLLPIPPRSKFPVQVVIGAYQWGRIVGQKIQTGGPVFQQFNITR